MFKKKSNAMQIANGIAEAANKGIVKKKVKPSMPEELEADPEVADNDADDKVKPKKIPKKK